MTRIKINLSKFSVLIHLTNHYQRPCSTALNFVNICLHLIKSSANLSPTLILLDGIPNAQNLSNSFVSKDFRDSSHNLQILLYSLHILTKQALLFYFPFRLNFQTLKSDKLPIIFLIPPILNCLCGPFFLFQIYGKRLSLNNNCVMPSIEMNNLSDQLYFFFSNGLVTANMLRISHPSASKNWVESFLVFASLYFCDRQLIMSKLSTNILISFFASDLFILPYLHPQNTFAMSRKVSLGYCYPEEKPAARIISSTSRWRK